MLSQLQTSNRFVFLAQDEPDDSDTDTDRTEPRIVHKPHDDASATSDDTLYFDANDDTPYFLTGVEPPLRERWEVASPIDFQNIEGVVS